ncbi:MAG: hypothetical protein WC632_02550 [Candidatus Margulisiibacteriota bacterium]
MGYAAGINTDTYIGGSWTPAAAGPGKQLTTAFFDDPAAQRLAGYVGNKASGKEKGRMLPTQSDEKPADQPDRYTPSNPKG